MFNKIKNIIWKSEGLEDVKTPKDKNIIFKVFYKDYHIAILELQNGEWIFYYTDFFKQSEDLPTIVDFQDKEKKYTANELWPFFTSRIPSLKQPRIQNIIIKKNINFNDMTDLLKNFGQRTITSPYELITV